MYTCDHVHTSVCLSVGVLLSLTGMVDAFRTIGMKEGLSGLYTGMSPTVQRAAIVAAAELASYDIFKSALLERDWEDGVKAHIVASLGAGFVATLASSPADVIKSRVMSQPVDENGVGKYYRGTMHCLTSTIKHDGFFSLWKGFWPNYGRLAPNVVLLFVSFEQFKRLAKHTGFIHGDA